MLQRCAFYGCARLFLVASRCLAQRHGSRCDGCYRESARRSVLDVLYVPCRIFGNFQTSLFALIDESFQHVILDTRAAQSCDHRIETVKSAGGRTGAVRRMMRHHPLRSVTDKMLSPLHHRDQKVSCREQHRSELSSYRRRVSRGLREWHRQPGGALRRLFWHRLPQ